MTIYVGMKDKKKLLQWLNASYLLKLFLRERGRVLLPFVFQLQICLSCLKSMLWVVWCDVRDSQWSCVKFCTIHNASGSVKDVWVQFELE